MLVSSIPTNSYTDTSLFNILLDWRLQFVIICVLCCILILFCWWKQYIKNLSVNQNLKQRSDNDQRQPFETSITDTIRKIPLQTSASKRRILVSKPLKGNNKKSSALSSSRTKKSYRTAKIDVPDDSLSTIKISLVVSKENKIDQIASNISLLTIHGTDGLKSKHSPRSIFIELPSTNIPYDISNQTENTSTIDNKSTDPGETE